MHDLFSRICLGVMATSLAIIAYAQVGSLNTQPTIQTASSESEPAKSKRCAQALAEAQVTLSTLEAQIKNVPAMVQTKDTDGQVTDESPNRLYEQLMLQIIQTKAEIEALTAKCDT